MKRVLTVGIGSRTFIIDEDACYELGLYLKRFRENVKMGIYTSEVMDDIENRIADLFSEAIGSSNNVVNLQLARSVMAQLGMPDEEYAEMYNMKKEGYNMEAKKKFYRDSDDKRLGGVCSGMAAYFNMDVLLLRIVAVVSLFFGGAGFWIYVIIWFVAPLAVTPAQKCEMRGLPVTAENMNRFSKY